MKIILKILALVFIIVFTISSCDPGHLPQTDKIDITIDDLHKLQNQIHPTKPIKIPDTIKSKPVLSNLYELPQDTTAQPTDTIN
jgi:hypothetical protein